MHRANDGRRRCKPLAPFFFQKIKSREHHCNEVDVATKTFLRFAYLLHVAPLRKGESNRVYEYNKRILTGKNCPHSYWKVD
jgi:hypothetical protein